MEDETQTPIIVCKRTTNVGECATEIPLTKENLKVMRPDVPLLCAICPSCGQSHILSKEKSQPLADLYFSEEIAERKQKTQKEHSAGSSDTPEDFRPSSKLAASVASTLNLLSYKGEKWKEKINAITELIRSVPSYQNAQGMYGLLAGWGVDTAHIQMVIQRAFSQNPDPMGQMIPNINIMSGAPNPMFTGGTPATMQQPMYMQTPSGQIVIVPQAPQVAPPLYEPADSGETVEEILGKDGKVAKRIIRRSSRAVDSVVSPTAAMVEMISALKDLGVIGHPATPPPPASPEVLKLADAMSQLTAIVQGIKNETEATRDSSSSQKMETMFEKLQEKIAALEDDKHESQIKDMQDQLERVRKDALDASERAARSGIPIEQRKIELQHDSLESVGGRAETVVMKALDPLIKMQEMQMKMNAVVMLRGMEQQDGVFPGTYINTIRDVTTAPEPSDTEVKAHVKRWRERAQGAKSASRVSRVGGSEK